MTWLVVGLGNPGAQYADTRHNVGFMTLDELARRAGVRWKNGRGMHAQVADTRIGARGIGLPGGEALVLAKPVTFMNESGQAVSALARFHHLGPEQIVVVHDELDLAPGQLRMKKGGGDNGHNGLRSIRAHLGGGEFHRVRIGIGRPGGHRAGADYVLGHIPPAMREDLALDIARAADAVVMLCTEGLGAAQNRFNA
ncbi:peptidyl-tRNA hydrolase, PTH1 family [Propionibacterium cyclohexanicum]|uniref:Peptidyl-tRNA hydrolase n=1 Tax=Propionibacterium cyclohexanicum TaxID=64702 RepID=A0A1H9RJA5_9ACTN|nr:aminoacyl-tRNA hydrolase [Propionibacterium cyclohexanicum]SER72113.1 peptidyl-tRNA hydrolase, PTH1 family [Propionibacterium cyclohexanicum]